MNIYWLNYKDEQHHTKKAIEMKKFSSADFFPIYILTVKEINYSVKQSNGVEINGFKFPLSVQFVFLDSSQTFHWLKYWKMNNFRWVVSLQDLEQLFSPYLCLSSLPHTEQIKVIWAELRQWMEIVSGMEVM